eukprot:jgi/Hompol1/661/HPOL_004256-RA
MALASSPAISIVLPGERVLPPSAEDDNMDGSDNQATPTPALRLGPGLIQVHGDIIATKAGSVKTAPGNRIWLEASQRRYVPSLGEPVVAVVVSRHTENYRVDIGGPHQASLPVLAFEGATKRNRPNLEPGTLVYARMSLANKDMEPEIECINPASGKADGFGELKGGFLIKCSLGMCRSLMTKNNPLFAGIGSALPFETAIGMNGRVWINAQSSREIILLANLIRAADGAPPAKIPALAKAFLKQLKESSD